MQSIRMPRPKHSGLKVLAVGIGLLLVLVAPILYIGSAGPTARMANAGKINAHSWHRFYAPITWAVERSDLAASAFRWCLNAGSDEFTPTPFQETGGPSGFR
jgi:hypothetical protein